ncbi:MAG: 4-phosphopantoate--beta-alanine ligase [Nitrososphaerales archaeon]|jgi:4-phosphopantoate--beta-alanine ligase
MGHEVPPDHPRAESLRTRERLIYHWKRGVVADAGLIAQGRGEAFDYLLGERTTAQALEATRAAAAHLLLAKRPVISVNGNAAALVPGELVELSTATGAALEVNLFYRSPKRLKAIASLLRRAGAREVLGARPRKGSAVIPELSSTRRVVDPEGIFAADVVLVPLEDGDRVEALRRMGKLTIAVDLNPLSRTSQRAAVTIVDNVVRAIPRLTSTVEGLKGAPPSKLDAIVEGYDNGRVLGASIAAIAERLARLSKTGGAAEPVPLAEGARR